MRENSLSAEAPSFNISNRVAAVTLWRNISINDLSKSCEYVTKILSWGSGVLFNVVEIRAW
jgi:hypothetical protein